MVYNCSVHVRAPVRGCVNKCIVVKSAMEISLSNYRNFPSTNVLAEERKRHQRHHRGSLCSRHVLMAKRSCTVTTVRQGQRFAKKPSTEQSSGRTPKEHSEIKDLLSIYQRCCWEASALKQIWDSFFLPNNYIFNWNMCDSWNCGYRFKWALNVSFSYVNIPNAWCLYAP